MARLERIAPVLPVRDVGAALDRYSALGFTAEAYRAEADLYGFLERDAVHLYVDDADALLAEWRAAGVEGSMLDPYDTEYGLREGHDVDPDGNLIRVGSPLPQG